MIVRKLELRHPKTRPWNRLGEVYHLAQRVNTKSPTRFIQAATKLMIRGVLASWRPKQAPCPTSSIRTAGTAQTLLPKSQVRIQKEAILFFHQTEDKMHSSFPADPVLKFHIILDFLHNTRLGVRMFNPEIVYQNAPGLKAGKE